AAFDIGGLVGKRESASALDRTPLGMGIEPGAGLRPKRRFLWSVLEVHATLPRAATGCCRRDDNRAAPAVPPPEWARWPWPRLVVRRHGRVGGRHGCFDVVSDSMSPIRRLARPLLAAVFVSGGIEVLRDPGGRVKKAEAVTSKLATLGL